MDCGEILLIVDVEDAIREHSGVEDLGEIVSQLSCMAQCCNVLTGVLEDGVIGHDVRGWRGKERRSKAEEESREDEVGRRERSRKEGRLTVVINPSGLSFFL